MQDAHQHLRLGRQLLVGGGVALGTEARAPAALDAVELQEVRAGHGAALDLVQVHHVEAVAVPRVVGLPLGETLNLLESAGFELPWQARTVARGGAST